jgi:hypothetical protein
MCVDRMALTLRSPDDQTTCGSSVGWKVIVLISSAGPPAVRSFSSEWRWATSPDWINASAMCAVNFVQLIVTPRAETASALQTTSIFGPLPLNDQRS